MIVDIRKPVNVWIEGVACTLESTFHDVREAAWLRQMRDEQ